MISTITAGGYIGIESRQVARLDDFGGGNYVPKAFPISPIRDTFIRTDESTLSISSSGQAWTTIGDQGGVGLGSNGVSFNQGYPVATAGSFNLLTTTDDADCEVYITIASKGSNTNDTIDITIRLQQYANIATVDGYGIRAIVQSGTDTIVLARVDNLVATTLMTFNQEFNVGDGFGMRCTGPILEAYYRSGLTGTFTRLGGIVDSTYPNGGRSSLTLVGGNTRVINLGGGTFISPNSSAAGKSMAGVMSGVSQGTI
jgi:hypothetical protein